MPRWDPILGTTLFLGQWSVGILSINLVFFGTFCEVSKVGSLEAPHPNLTRIVGLLQLRVEDDESKDGKNPKREEGGTMREA